MHKLREKLVKAIQLCPIASYKALGLFERLLRLAVPMLVLLAASSTLAQTTSFTHQGALTDNAIPASGHYDFQFKLFDTATVGTGAQQGATLTVPNVQVTAGIFTVELDFGASVFDGTARFLEISVRAAGSSDPFTVLSPRPPIGSSPYAVRSASAGAADTATNATQLGGLPASAFIQNATSQQTATNFNISGTGTASILNATTQFNLNGNRVLSRAGTNNLFVGVNTGANNTTGQQNAFFGEAAGLLNTTGSNNSFFGSGSGQSNTAGGNNSFFGTNAGLFNTTGQLNAFFGSGAGQGNTTGSRNSFFGGGVGEQTTTGSDNSFYGFAAGFANITGASNSFFGSDAGGNNTTGGFNSFFGKGAGRNNTTAGGNAFFGTSAGFNNTTGTLNTFIGEGTGSANITGSGNTFIGRDADFDAANPTGDNNTLLGANTRVLSGVSNSTAIGAGVVVSTNDTIVLGKDLHTVQIPGSINVSGNFSAPFVNTTQLRIGGFPVVTAPGTDNIFVGVGAGQSNNTGSANSFFGRSAGFNNTSGQRNTFIGEGTGSANTTGTGNTFIGRDADFNIASPTGDNNTLLGTGARVSSGVSNSTAIGAGATVSTSNTIVLGTQSQKTLLDGRFRTGTPFDVGGELPGRGYLETFFLTNIFQGIYTPNVLFGSYANNPRGNVNTCVLFQSIPGLAFGATLTNCISGFSSIRDKTDVQPFTGGLDLIRRLKPVAFKHKENGMPGIGLNTEDVAEVEPSLIQRDEKLSYEEVDKSSLVIHLINAIKNSNSSKWKSSRKRLKRSRTA